MQKKILALLQRNKSISPGKFTVADRKQNAHFAAGIDVKNISDTLDQCTFA